MTQRSELHTIEALQSENEQLRRRIAELEAERRRSAQSLPYFEIFDSFPIPIVVRRADGVAVGANRLHYQGTGLSPQDTERLQHNILEDEQAIAGGFVAGFRRAVEGEVVEMPPAFYDLSQSGLPGANDLELWIDTLFFPVVDETGAKYVIEMHRDVTQQQVELADRQAAEEENRRLQDEVQRAREATLRALSTPLIPIAEGVLVMPLIGDVDKDRARQVLEALLEGVARNHARSAILDVTGVTGAGREIADGLVQVAKAVRLLGAKVVLTGIQPQMAQAIAAMGEDLRDFVVCGTLESGVAHVLQARRAGTPQG